MRFPRFSCFVAVPKAANFEKFENFRPQGGPKTIGYMFFPRFSRPQGRPRPPKTAPNNFNEVFQKGFSRRFFNKVFFPLSEPSCDPKRSPAALEREGCGLGHRAFLVLSEAFFS